MTYLDLLREGAKKHNIACYGYDPLLEKIPLRGPPKEVIARYNQLLMDAFQKAVLPGTIKPNAAFFEQYGIEGMESLNEVLALGRKLGLVVILDAKRGDIGKTSAAYARAVFEALKADAVTVAPYMGYDSLSPFFEYCGRGKGCYVLCRTSNKGASDFQDLEVNGTPMYMKVAEKIVEWWRPGVSAVVGATFPEELERVARFFVRSGKEIPLLIPGVGSQGASVRETLAVLRKVEYDLSLVRINSSSAIAYAYEREKTEDFAGAAARALKALVAELK